MNTQRIKSTLLKTLGDRPTAFIQAIRFVYQLQTNDKPDPETVLLPTLLHRGDLAIDIGANGADWTLHLSRCVGDEGELYAFEADPYYALATELAIKLMRLKGVHFFPLRIIQHGQRSSTPNS